MRCKDASLELSWELKERHYLEHQLGKVSSGERVHHATKDALRRRGYIRPSGKGLTEYGQKTLVEVRRHLANRCTCPTR